MKKNQEKTINSLIRIYVKKLENRIKLKIKTGHYSKLSTRETMKFLRNNKSKTAKNKNGDNALFSSY